MSFIVSHLFTKNRFLWPNRRSRARKTVSFENPISTSSCCSVDALRLSQTVIREFSIVIYACVIQINAHDLFKKFISSLSLTIRHFMTDFVNICNRQLKVKKGFSVNLVITFVERNFWKGTCGLRDASFYILIMKIGQAVRTIENWTCMSGPHLPRIIKEHRLASVHTVAS